MLRSDWFCYSATYLHVIKIIQSQFKDRLQKLFLNSDLTGVLWIVCEFFARHATGGPNALCFLHIIITESVARMGTNEFISEG